MLYTNHVHFLQLRKRALTAGEFVAPLSKIDPIYKEEEEAYKVIQLAVLIEILQLQLKHYVQATALQGDCHVCGGSCMHTVVGPCTLWWTHAHYLVELKHLPSSMLMCVSAVPVHSFRFGGRRLLWARRESEQPRERMMTVRGRKGKEKRKERKRSEHSLCVSVHSTSADSHCLVLTLHTIMELS